MQRKATIVDAYPDQQGYPDQEQDNQDQEQIETIHLYIVPENEYQENNSPTFDTRKWIHRLMACVACILLAFFVLVPGSKLYEVKSLTVPLVSLPVQTFVTSAKIQATGVKQYPALAASGLVTIYNGSLLSQTLPSGFIITSSDGQEFALDTSITIDGALLPAVGMATVSVHALQAGSQGNIAALAINQNYGSSLVVKNLAAFSGGQDSYSESYVTASDKQQALQAARATLTSKKPLAIQKQPCQETATDNTQSMVLTWQCQFYRYHVPGNLDIVSIQVQANDVLIQYQEVRHE